MCVLLPLPHTQLLASLDTVEEEANIIQMGKLAVEEENRSLRDQNFEIQSRARAADAQLKKVKFRMMGVRAKGKEMYYNHSVCSLLFMHDRCKSRMRIKTSKSRY